MAKLTVTTRALKKAKKERRLNQTRIREQPPNPGKGLQVNKKKKREKKKWLFCNEKYCRG